MGKEYRQLEVKTEGFFTATLPNSCFVQLNTLAEEGWHICAATPLSRAFGRTDYVCFVLEREK